MVIGDRTEGGGARRGLWGRSCRACGNRGMSIGLADFMIQSGNEVRRGPIPFIIPK